MIRAIIVDDEESGRKGLQIVLQKHCPEVEIVGSYGDPAMALENINLIGPDLVFLDIQMPEMSGFDLLERIPKINFEVIFVTSYDKYAIKAIKFSALDYLLKPIDVDDLLAAVEKIKQRQEGAAVNYRSLLANMKIRADKLTRLAIPTEQEIILQELSEIIYCEASGSYSIVHLPENKSIIVSRTLKDFEQILPQSDFYRIHHSFLVNVGHVIKYVRGEGGYVVVTGGQHLDVSRRKKEGFLQILNKI